MRFEIKAINRQGDIQLLALEAPDAASATRQAEHLGCHLLSIRTSRTFSVSGQRGHFPLLLFGQEILSLLEAGISLAESLEALAEREGRPPIKAVLDRLITRLHEGRTLSTAMEEMPETFPPLFVAAIRASEKTSDLDEALRRYIAYQQQLDELRGKLVSAAIYPAILVSVGGLVILFLLAFVVPRFSRIYEDLHGELPWMSRVLMEWGHTVDAHGGVMALGFVILLAVGFHASMSPVLRKRVGDLLWRIPALGERMRIFQLSRCFRTTGMLLKGGVAIPEALGMVAGLLAPQLQHRLGIATNRIREGIPLSRALEEAHLVTPVALRLLRVGEQTGNMGDMMERAAAFHDQETARWIDWVTKLFGPILMMGIGLMIGLIVVMLYLPIFQVAESIG